MEKKVRELLMYKSYFKEFYRGAISESTKQDDILENIECIPTKYLKHIESTDGLYEMRITLGSDIFRVFCFFDKGRLVVLLSGFQKKTQKTPKKEIDKAVRLMAQYYDDKKRR